jgi:hypothetical protein
LVVVIIGIIPGQNTPGEYRLKTQWGFSIGYFLENLTFR